MNKTKRRQRLSKEERAQKWSESIAKKVAINELKEIGMTVAQAKQNKKIWKKLNANYKSQKDYITSLLNDAVEYKKETWSRVGKAYIKMYQEKFDFDWGSLKVAKAEKLEKSQIKSRKNNISISARKRVKALEAAKGEIYREEVQPDGTKKILGVYEATGNNDGIPAERYSGGQKVKWCQNFVNWSMKQANISLPGDPKLQGWTDYMMAQFHEQKKFNYFDKTKTTDIKPGDVLYFGDPDESNGYNQSIKGNPSHVGIIKEVKPDGTIITIDGNISNKVTEVEYSPGSDQYKRIIGIAKP